MRSVMMPPTAVIGAPRAAVAIPQSGTLVLGAQTLHNVHVEGGILVPSSGKFHVNTLPSADSDRP